MIDLANAFDDAGYEVTLITGRLMQRNIPLKKTIRIFRVVEYRKNGYISRFVTWISAFFQMIYLVWFKTGGSHLLIVTNPPISPFIPFFVRNSYSLLFYDVYIETFGKYLPFKNKSILSKIWVSLHKRSLKKAYSIFTLTEGMKANLENFVSNKTIFVVPIWTDIVFLKPIPKEENSFISQNNLENKFIVMYSGNLGLNNGLAILLEAAKKIKNPNIHILIIGEGIGKHALQKKAKELLLQNVSFLNWQPAATLPYSLAAADIAVVTLPLLSGNNSIPSKFFNYLAVGSPILGISPEKSDLADLISTYDVGQNFYKPTVEKLINFIEFMGNENNQKHFRDQSIRAAKNFTKQNAHLIIEHL